MIRIRIIVLLVVGMTIITGCSKGESDQNSVEQDDGIEQNDENNDEIPVVLDPDSVTLIFPKNKTECNEGVFIDNSWSIVTFRWNPSNNTDHYELWYRQEGIGSWTKETTSDTEIDVQIHRGKQYQWKVISKNKQSSKNATSENWNFYNAGSGEENYAPFPATLINPKDGDVMNSKNNSNYYFQWDASDLDNDPLTFDLYVGTHPDSLNIVKNLQKTSELMVYHISFGVKHYWKIKTSDSNGNSSLSETWSFTRY